MRLFRRNRDKGEAQPTLRTEAGGDSRTLVSSYGTSGHSDEVTPTDGGYSRRSALEDSLRAGNPLLDPAVTAEFNSKGYHSVTPTKGGYLIGTMGVGNYLLDPVTVERISKGYYELIPTEIPGVFVGDRGTSRYILDANERDDKTGAVKVIDNKFRMRSGDQQDLRGSIYGVKTLPDLIRTLSGWTSEYSTNSPIPHSRSGGSNRGSDGFVTGLIVGSLLD